MIDLKTLIRLYRAWLIALAAVVLAALAFWQFRGYGGRPEVGATIDQITTNAKTNERRVEIIFDRKEKEEAMGNEKITEKLRTVSDDDLPELLTGLLSDWRRDHPGR